MAGLTEEAVTITSGVAVLTAGTALGRAFSCGGAGAGRIRRLRSFRYSKRRPVPASSCVSAASGVSPAWAPGER